MSDLNSEITKWIAIAKGDKCPLCKGTGSIRGGHVTCPKCGGKKVAKDANESLATVMRHDQDHDNWHKMHGDAPCTSEADCAQKRAKYAEVQAEQVTKGDVVGHEFHGNQFTTVAAENDFLRPANNLHLQHYDNSHPSFVSEQHERAAALHRNISNHLRTLAQHAIDAGHPITSSSLRHAAEMHTAAAQAHEDAVRATLEHGVSQESVNVAYLASRASRDATAATDSALNLAQDTGLAPAQSSF